MKIVSQLDADGYFVGPVKAARSPLEVGVFHIPRGAVDAPPPEVPPGHRARWVPGFWAAPGDGGQGGGEAVWRPGSWEFSPLPAPPALPPYVPPTPEALQADALRQIDHDVDRIYADVIGYRATEYEAAEREALAYQAAGFAGEVPPSVASWVAASGLGAQAAALNILEEAEAWRTAAQMIRAQRLLAKAGVRAGEISQSMTAWGGFVQQMRLALGV
ncbi:hypothetical protein [Hydrogenophaga sp.]|uniref:hypothetical protein n=1 Tax=Hydrogenophaga sp. TaxID=1904254 RepID=UPI003D0AED6C